MKSSIGGASKKAVPLVVFNEANQFGIHPEGAKLFESQTEPFAILIVTGLYRTGKSYLLNQLIEEKDAFTVDPTTQACTRGIWAARINFFCVLLYPESNRTRTHP